MHIGGSVRRTLRSKTPVWLSVAWWHHLCVSRSDRQVGPSLLLVERRERENPLSAEQSFCFHWICRYILPDSVFIALDCYWIIPNTIVLSFSGQWKLVLITGPELLWPTWEGRQRARCSHSNSFSLLLWYASRNLITRHYFLKISDGVGVKTY